MLRRKQQVRSGILIRGLIYRFDKRVARHTNGKSVDLSTLANVIARTRTVALFSPCSVACAPFGKGARLVVPNRGQRDGETRKSYFVPLRVPRSYVAFDIGSNDVCVTRWRSYLHIQLPHPRRTVENEHRGKL